MNIKPLLVLLLLFFVKSPLFSQIPNYLLYDFKQSQQFGSENIVTIHKLLYKAEDFLLPSKLWEENTVFKKGAGIGYRTLKLGLIDLQIDYLLVLTQHEVFGHGARYREFGYKESSYILNFAIPFGDGSGLAISGARETGRLFTHSEQIAKIHGGNEANIVLSENIGSRVLFDNKIHYREGLLYLISKNNLLAYIWFDKFRNDGSISNFANGDIASYVMRMNSENFESGKRYTLNKLAWQSTISLLNPIQLYTAFTIGKTYLLDGNEIFEDIPTIKINAIKYLPAFGYNLTPFGSEFILTQYFITETKLIQVKINLGDNTFHEFFGGGIQVYSLINLPKFMLSANLEGWYQPAIKVGGKTIEQTKGGLGYLFKTDMSLFPFNNANSFGFFTQLGYKTNGYVLGEQLKRGLIFKFGLALKMN